MIETASPAFAGMASGALLSMRRVPSSHGEAERTISVRLADCDGLRNEASILVNRMYAWRGYGAHHRLVEAEHRATFAASAEDRIVGTLTLTMDAPAGLSTDHTFKTELDELRKVGGTLCELTKFAVDRDIKSAPVLAALFHVIFIYGIERYGCTDVVIEVHPRHVRYYEAMLGFECVGPPKIDTSVAWWPSDTPVQLMHLNLADMRQKIDRQAGRNTKMGRSLYPYFFSHEEEMGISARIARLDGGKNAKQSLTQRSFSGGAYWSAAA